MVTSPKGYVERQAAVGRAGEVRWSVTGARRGNKFRQGEEGMGSLEVDKAISSWEDVGESINTDVEDAQDTES